eukprot:gene7200-7414_t
MAFLVNQQLDALLDIAKILDPANAFLKDWKCNETVTNETEVTCFCSNRVYELDLADLGLNGSLPDGSILKQLPSLEAIDVSLNMCEKLSQLHYAAMNMQHMHTSPLPAIRGSGN